MERIQQHGLHPTKHRLRLHTKCDGVRLRLRRRDFSGNAQLPAFDKFGYGRVVFDVLVQLRHQRPLTIPLVRSDDMHTFRLERVRRAHHGSDVEIVCPVGDHGDRERQDRL